MAVVVALAVALIVEVAVVILQDTDRAGNFHTLFKTFVIVKQLTEWTNYSGIWRQPLTIISSIIETNGA